MEETEIRVRRILAEIGDCPPDADRDADIYDDLGFASVHAMTLLAELEEQFAIRVPDDDFIDARSIAKLTELTHSLIQKNPPALNV